MDNVLTYQVSIWTFIDKIFYVVNVQNNKFQ